MSVTDAVQPATDDADKTTHIAVGAAVGAAVGLLVLVACSVVLVVWIVRLVRLVKRKHSKQGLLTRIHTVVYMATLTHTCSCVCMLTQEMFPPAVERCTVQVSGFLVSTCTVQSASIPRACSDWDCPCCPI